MGTLRTVTVPMQPESQSRPQPAAAARRRGLRAGAVSVGVVLGSWTATTVAAPPDGWENAVNDSMLTSMIKLVGIPLAIIAVITLLTYLPSMIRRGRGAADPADYFSEHSEWFGGPRTTPEAVEATAATSDNRALGGASARW